MFHKILGTIMLICSLVLALQATAMIMLSDNDRIEILRGAGKMYRASHEYGPLERAPTDEEIEERLVSQRESLLAESKKDNFTPIAMKFLFSLILLVTAAGLFMNKRNPTKVLATIMAILLTIAMLAKFKEFISYSELYKHVSLSSITLKLLFFTDKAMLLAIPLAFLSCLITAIKPPALPEGQKPISADEAQVK